MVNVDSFVVREVILHDVPRHDEDAQVTLTDAPIILDEQLRDYFRRKIVSSLELRGLDVVADPNGKAVVREGVAAILRDPTNLVEVSKEIARHLDDSQSNRNPAGLLAVVAGSVGSEPCVAVLKLEREQGLRFVINVVAGQTRVDLQFLRDLTLTDKTRVFKTSILCLMPGGGAETMFGRVSDSQRGRDDGLGVATFFMATFLGCMLRTSPEKATHDFVRAAEDYFNSKVADPERQARYQVALLATLQDQALDLSPRDFANDHLEPHDRPGFLERVAAEGLEPRTTFSKDLSLVKVGKFRMVFEHGMTLVGSPQDLDERVDVKADHVGIKDAVKRLNGR